MLTIRPQSRRSRAAWGGLALAAAAFATAVPDAGAASSDVRRLRRGVFLYASPALRDPNFAETVVLLVHHEAGGAMGLVINRVTDTRAAEALPAIKALRDLLVYQGGPVSPEAMIALVRASRPPRESVRVLEDVYMTGRREDLESAARSGAALERVRLYLGYAGWGAGQLENEVKLGGWVVTAGSAAPIFSERPRALWERVFQLLQRREARGEATLPRAGSRYGSAGTASLLSLERYFSNQACK